MIIVVLVILGLCLGSFTNALVWRLRIQETTYKKSKTPDKFSILNGRSMCPDCRHQLAAIDLIPVFSWLALRGKCRYCHKKISFQYPLVELSTAGVFLFSYFFWPNNFNSENIILFVMWLIFVVGFMALTIYDIKWLLLPNRIVYPLIVLAIIEAIIRTIYINDRALFVGDVLLSLVITSGLFYVIYQLSKGQWIGGGDIKLLFIIGMLLSSPIEAFFLLFSASILGLLVSLPLMIAGKLKTKSLIPFGPFLILATVITYIFGSGIVSWYKGLF